MFVFKAAVVGAGTMGAEIAHVIASAGIPVVLKDLEPERVEAGVARARSLWQAQVDGGKLEAAELERRAGLITAATDYAPFGDVDFAIEAVPERMEDKHAVFSELDEATPGHAILASNTSALSITEIGQATIRPDKVVGFHFFFPATQSRLVEVVEGEDTSTETAQAAAAFAQAIRKAPIRCADAPGFVVNRILNAGVTELWRAQEESGVDVEAFDRILGEAAPSKLGPFFIADLLGLDTVVHVAEHMRDCYGDRFHVHARMRELVDDGRLGAKTGQGFYDHRG
ncbi:MAG TPA: 3-hydroxyacyl-CoA dehydrogenase family protein [Solirubrobacteraceae bacterium]|jgi:3-hydroxyacyl-CoA dehydrogenase